MSFETFAIDGAFILTHTAQKEKTCWRQNTNWNSHRGHPGCLMLETHPILPPQTWLYSSVTHHCLPALPVFLCQITAALRDVELWKTVEIDPVLSSVGRADPENKTKMSVLLKGHLTLADRRRNSESIHCDTINVLITFFWLIAIFLILNSGKHS